jgi:predicted ester cyclase
MTSPGRQSETNHEALQLHRTEIEALYHRLIEEVVNDGQLDIVDEIVGSDFVMHVAGDPEPVRGPDGLKEHVQAWRTAFPDLHLDVDAVLIQGNRVVGRWTLTGTHEAELMGIEPSEAQVSIRGVEIDRVENSEFVEIWEIVDTLSLFEQLGVIDPLTE